MYSLRLLLLFAAILGCGWFSTGLHGFRQPPDFSVASRADRLNLSLPVQTQVDRMRMLQIESDDSVRTFELIQVVEKRGDRRRAVLRFLRPAEMAGMMLFCDQKGKTRDDLYYVFPSADVFEKIEGKHKTAYFADSPWTYEDFLSMDRKEEKTEVIGQQMFEGILCSRVVARSPERGTDYRSMYGRREMLISMRDGLLRQVEYFGWNNRVIKTITYRDYTQRVMEGEKKIAIPGRLELYHHERDTTAIVTFLQSAFDAPIPERLLTAEGVRTWGQEDDLALMGALAVVP